MLIGLWKVGNLKRPVVILLVKLGSLQISNGPFFGSMQQTLTFCPWPLREVTGFFLFSQFSVNVFHNPKKCFINHL
jgi:hypothetical protein